MDNAGVSVHWEDDGKPSAPAAPSAPVQRPRAPKIVFLGLLLVVGSLIGGLIIVGRGTTRDLAEPPSPPQDVLTPAPRSSTSTTTTTTLPSAPGTRALAQFDGQVLGVDVGTSVVSTDFDGRLFALDLDTGILTRSRIRTGNFVTVAGRLVVQTGCGSWQVLEIPSFVPGAELIDCSTSYRPIDRLGAQASIFAQAGAGATQGVLIDNGEGGLSPIALDNDLLRGDTIASSIVTTSGARVLVERTGDELVWIDPATSSVESYATGRVLAAGPNGILWSDSCDSERTCEVWFGTPDNPKVLGGPFRVAPFDLDQPARINRQGSRAVFFKSDGMLRIVTTETGHAREVENPGITASLATWSPDGLWLLQASGTNIVALNALTGRVIEFEGIPGDFSPGWIALPVTG